MLHSAGIWIVNGNSAVGHYVTKCVKCQRYHDSPVNQQMADLPKDHMGEGPPFAYRAVHYFGPFYMKEGRRQLIPYGVLFTCLSTHAIHLETTASLMTDLFLNAYCRFLLHHGPVRQLRSDQGLHFIGTVKELKTALSEMNHDKIK